jgi:hypothetical protein
MDNNDQKSYLIYMCDTISHIKLEKKTIKTFKIA